MFYCYEFVYQRDLNFNSASLTFVRYGYQKATQQLNRQTLRDSAPLPHLDQSALSRFSPTRHTRSGVGKPA